MKKALSLFLVALMLIGMLPMTAPHAHAADTESVKITVTGTTGTKNGTTSISWSKDLVTFTNEKDQSTTAIRTSDSDHYRVYAKSKVVIKAPGNITSIVITSTESKYNSPWVTSGSAVGTASNSGNVITIVPTTPATEISFSATAQVRLKDITVTYEVAGGDAGCAHANTENHDAVAPGCEAPGYEAGVYCSDCESYIEGHEVIAATGHAYGDWIDVTAATCTEAGEQKAVCANCNGEKTQTVAALGHNYVDGVCAGCGHTAVFTKYELVTDASSLKAGDQLIIVGIDNAGDYFVMLPYVSGNNNLKIEAISAAVDGKIELADTSAAAVITLGGDSSAWTLNDGTYYLCATGGTSSNHLKGQTSLPDNNTGAWTIVIDNNGKATITSIGNSSDGARNTVFFNYNNDLFACYKADYNSNADKVYIYRLDDGKEECAHANTTSTTVDPTCQNPGSTTVVCDDCKETVSTTALPVVDHVYVDNVCKWCGDDFEGETDTTDPTTEPSSEPTESEPETSEPETSEPETVETEATISFATKDQRVSLDTNAQVWSNGGLTVTNNKTPSSSNVADYANPVRFYKSSSLTFEFKAMHTIIVTCKTDASKGYAAALAASVEDENATATVAGDVVTITLATPVDTFTISAMSAQVQVYSIVVKGTSSCAHVWDAGVETVPAGCTTSGTVTYTCTKCGETKTDNIPATGHNYAVSEGELLCGNCSTSPVYTDISATRDYETNKVYYLKGIVTHISGQNIYIEDATGGICVRFNSENDAAGIALGDEIVVWDALSKYNGLIQTSYTLASEYVKLSSGNELPSKVVTIADLNADTTNEYLGERVVIENVTIGIISSSGNTPVTDADGNSINIRALTGIAENVTEGDTVTVTAIVSTYNGYQLIVNPGTAATDVVVTKEAGEVVRETVTIAEAKNGTTAESYQVEGVVTFIDSSNYYIQDATGAILVRASGLSASIGDKILAYGSYDLYNGLIQLNCDAANVQVISSGNTVEAQPVTLAGLVADTSNEYLAEKVTLANLCITKVGSYSTTYMNVDYTVSDGNGNTIVLYRTPAATEDDVLSVGTLIDVVAIVSSNNGYRLRVVAEEDITCTGACEHVNKTEVVVPATLGKAGSKTVTCDLCGTVTESVELAPLAAVDSWGLTLDDSINVNFKVIVDASVKAQAGARIVITVGEGEFAETVTYSLSSNEASDTEYLVSTNMGAAQMGDTITVKVLTDADEGIEKTYSIKSYAETILADQDYAEYHDVVKAMLTYGAAAQTYFGYKTEAMVPSYECAMEVPESVDYVIGTEGSIDGIAFYGATMIFREKIAVRYYFTGDATKVTTMEGLQIVAVDENKFYVEVSHAIADLDSMGYVVLYSAENEEVTLFVSYSAMNYVVRMNQNGSENLKPLLKALYNYHRVAAELAESKNAE